MPTDFKGEECNWDRDEVSELKRAIQEVPSTVEKQERWRRIATIVGTRSKRECYEKYKKLKEEKAKRTSDSEAKPSGEDPSSMPTVKAVPGDALRLAALSAAEAKPRRYDDESDDDLDDLLGAVGLAEAKDSLGAQAAPAMDEPVAKRSSDASHSLRLGRGMLRGGGSESKSSSSLPPFSSTAPGTPSTSEPTGIHVTSRERPVRGQCKAGRVVLRTPITIEEANEIKALLFNDSKKAFPDSWKRQGFYFNDKRKLGYGLVQRAGGPCGVIASVNAYVVAELLFVGMPLGAASFEGSAGWQQPPPEAQQRALVSALSSMLFNASSGSGRCVVGLPHSTQHLHRTSVYAPDGVTDRLVLCTLEVEASEGLDLFLRDNLAAFTDPQGSGCLSLLLSVMLTRGLGRVRADMDEGFAGEVRSLLDRHNYMAQEGVNLLLCGRAVSNVFDGERELTDQIQGSEDVVRLKGVPSRGTQLVGFLSLAEAYNYIEVGRAYKEPQLPVWVVFSESHYSLVFGIRPELARAASNNAPFDLYYWDPLARQDEVIRFTVARDHDEDLPDVNDDRALIPPLDLVLRTKWTGCAVDWNNSEPIL